MGRTGPHDAGTIEIALVSEGRCWFDTVGFPSTTLGWDASSDRAPEGEDLGAAIAELRTRGLKVSDPSAVGATGRQQAFTIDPWGNAIELHQRA